MRAGILRVARPRPDLSSFVRDGRVEAIAWVGDTPRVQQSTGWGRRVGEQRLDLSGFVTCSTEATATRAQVSNVLQTAAYGAYGIGLSSGSSARTSTPDGMGGNPAWWDTVTVDGECTIKRCPALRPSDVEPYDPDDEFHGTGAINPDTAPSPLDSPPAYAGYEVKGDASTCEEDIFAQVWGFLKTNSDLVEWALCAADADDDVIGCILDALAGDRATVSIRFDDGRVCETGENSTIWDPCCAGKMNAHGGLFGGELKICTSAGFWDTMPALLCSGAGDPYGADCAVVALASIVLHELVHVCGGPTHDEDDFWTSINEMYCDVAYNTGFAFQFAAFQRFRRAGLSPCCDPFEGFEPGVMALPPTSDDCIESSYYSPDDSSLDFIEWKQDELTPPPT